MTSLKEIFLYFACSGNNEIEVNPGCVLVSKKYILFFLLSNIKSVLAIDLQPNILWDLLARLRHLL